MDKCSNTTLNGARWPSAQMPHLRSSGKQLRPGEVLRVREIWNRWYINGGERAYVQELLPVPVTFLIFLHGLSFWVRWSEPISPVSTSDCSYKTWAECTEEQFGDLKSKWQLAWRRRAEFRAWDKYTFVCVWPWYSLAYTQCRTKHRSSYWGIHRERPKKYSSSGKRPIFYSLLFSIPLHPKPQVILQCDSSNLVNSPREPKFWGWGRNFVYHQWNCGPKKVWQTCDFLLCPPGTLHFFGSIMKRGTLEPESSREKKGSLGESWPH